MSIDDIKLVGLMGGGVMGGGIAQTFAAHGFKTIIRDLNDDLIEKTRASMVEGRFGLKGSVERGKMTQAEYDATLARFSFTQNVGDLADCDLIVEAVPENLDLKKSVFTELDATVKKSAIFATNTSGFAIADVNKAVSRRDRFIGFHWFSPAFIMKPVEIIYAPETSEETIATMEAVGEQLEKVTIRVKDAPGQVRLRRQPHLLRDGRGGAQGARRRRRQRRRHRHGDEARLQLAGGPAGHDEGRARRLAVAASEPRTPNLEPP